jgi:hypothetical protein
MQWCGSRPIVEWGMNSNLITKESRKMTEIITHERKILFLLLDGEIGGPMLIWKVGA